MENQKRTISISQVLNDIFEDWKTKQEDKNLDHLIKNCVEEVTTEKRENHG